MFTQKRVWKAKIWTNAVSKSMAEKYQSKTGETKSNAGCQRNVKSQMGNQAAVIQTKEYIINLMDVLASGGTR